MTNDVNLYNALDDCIERMDEGAPLDEVLRDYPEYAGDLRELLQVAQWVTQAEIPPDETLAALGRTRKRVKLKVRDGRRAWWRPLVAYAAAAVLATAMVGTTVLFYGMLLPERENPASVPFGPPSGDIQATATAIIAGATGTQAARLTGTTAPGAADIIYTSTASMRGGTAAPIATSVASMDGAAAATLTHLPSRTPSADDLASATAIRETATTGAAGDRARSTPPAGFNPRSQLNPPSQIPPTATPRGTVTPLPDDYQPPQLAPLNAGSIDDNANYDEYLLYRRNFRQAYPDFTTDVDTSMRQVITVTDVDGRPVLGAQVVLRDPDTLELAAIATTYADGRTFFFPNATTASQDLTVFDVTVVAGDRSEAFTLDLRDGPNWAVELPTDPQAHDRIQLDVAFVLDTTGSMNDEIAELQNNILNIAEQIDALGVDTRYGLVIYRDHPDTYDVLTTPFTGDVRAFQATLADVVAGGGGDYPESVNRALHEAVNGLSWREGDTIRLAFLVADAPPHFRDPYRYTLEMRNALALGIKFNPIASSGLDQVGEYIFRQLAQVTNGTFIFLTYADAPPRTETFEWGGEAGTERGDLAAGEAPADFTVEQLDALVLQLIQAEIATQRGSP